MIVPQSAGREDASHRRAQEGASEELLGGRVDLDRAHRTASAFEHMRDRAEYRSGRGWRRPGVSRTLRRAPEQDMMALD
jgi:hypothetical protein